MIILIIKTDAFFEDIKNRDNINIIESIDKLVKEIFEKNIHNIMISSFINNLPDVVE